MYSCSKIFDYFILRARQHNNVDAETKGNKCAGSRYVLLLLEFPLSMSAQKLKVAGLYKVESAYCCLLNLITERMDNGYMGHDRGACKVARCIHCLSSFPSFVSFPMKICPKESLSLTKYTWL